MVLGLAVLYDFHFEKQMSLMDTFGALAEYLVWEVVTGFTGEAIYMDGLRKQVGMLLTIKKETSS